MDRKEYKTYIKVLASFDWKLTDIKVEDMDDKNKDFKTNFYQALINDFINKIGSYDYQQMVELTSLIDTSVGSAVNLNIDKLIFTKQNYKLTINPENTILKQKDKLISQIKNDQILKLDSNFLNLNKNLNKKDDPYLLSSSINDVPFFLINSDKDAKQLVKQYIISNFFNPNNHTGSLIDILDPFKSKAYQELSNHGFNLLASRALGKFTYNKDLDTVSHDLISKFYYKAYMPKHKDPYWNTYTRVSWDDGTLSDPKLLYTINKERFKKWSQNNNISYNCIGSYQNLLNSVKKLSSEDKILELFKNKEKM